MANIENRKNEELLNELNEENLEKVSGGQVGELNVTKPQERPLSVRPYSLGGIVGKDKNDPDQPLINPF